MTDDDLFHTVIAHGAVSPTAQQNLLENVASNIVAPDRATLFKRIFNTFLPPWPDPCVAEGVHSFAEPDNKGAAGKASPRSRPIRSLTSPDDEVTSSRWRSRQNVRCFPMAKSGSQIDGWANSRIFRRVLGTSIRGIWIHLPASLRLSSPGQAYGRFVHALILRYAKREQAFRN